MKKRIRLHVSLFSLLVFWGCSSTQNTTNQRPAETRYSLVYVIHADANYTYHLKGERRKADLDVLNKAIETGRKAKYGEVFIFHQKPENKLLFFIPKRDRHFYHYRNGELIGGNSYSPRNGGLKAEAEIYKQKRAKSNSRNVFLYFGHEIPTGTQNLVYHQSQPSQHFNARIFADGLKMFDEYFELTVLSTCNNGNPLMVDQLTGVTDFLVASPQNLHLSHLTDQPLNQLETNPDITSEELARHMAKDSFERLSSFLRTAVTVAVYNLNLTENYIDSLAEGYRNHLNNISQTSLFVNNTDCERLPGFKNPLPQDGVTLHHQPAMFGTNSTVEKFSGWGCKQ